MLCACANAAENTTPSQQTEATVDIITEPMPVPTTDFVTEPPEIPTTQPPRVIGPDRIEGDAAIIENVTVDYLDALPRSIEYTATYRATDSKDDLKLDESQVYAVIQFRMTSKTTKEIEIADIHDDFLVELIYDNRYVYSPDNGSRSVFQTGSQVAVVGDSSSVGAVTLAPLSSKDVTVYIPCAREVSTQLDQELIVVFTSSYCGYENFEFIIR
jgi:hypothetical protein